MTRDEFAKRFDEAAPASVGYRDGLEQFAKRVYDAIFETIDGCVMPPTEVWMEDIIKKLEAK